LYAPVVEILFQQQTRGSEGFNTVWTCQTETYDRLVMRRYEVDYFKEAFLARTLESGKSGLDWRRALNTSLKKRAGQRIDFFFTAIFSPETS